MAKKTPSKTRQNQGSRRLKQADYRSFRFSRRIKTDRTRLPAVWGLTRMSLGHLRRNWKPFLAASMVYGLLLLILVRGLSGGVDIVGLKNAAVSQKSASPSSITLFGALLGGSNTASSDVASLYQTLLFIIGSLAFIWLLRHTQDDAEKAVRARDAYYKGMTPLVPFILVLLVMVLELLPLVIANGVYSYVILGGLANTSVEQLLWYVLIGLFLVLSLYMITSSIIALYIVTLPGMTPIRALRSARKLVRYRRWTIMRKILVFPVLLILAGAIIIVPVISFAPVLAEWLFFAGTVAILPILHSYMYSLYRALL